ncbi:response regulator transcription factor [Alkalicoccus halolimnae]|uniref:LuxR C-terminal-related transcriptional regulator n=1 Tax=Alkalicoccus halolimnae TaxID=1667239 RepID=A0A5C7F4P8_9BACI|nr:LuxR C-terminal-related transcriptional regulator [Alkalicoccus halolimnae]TXF85631.1 response regulator transcription factor [Alkalicoccus halolimnae]
MHGNQLTADRAVDDRILIIDYDRYLSGSSEQRLKDILSEKQVIIEKNSDASLNEANYVFLLVESVSLESLGWIEGVLGQLRGVKVLVVTVGRPKASLVPYISNRLNGILSLHSLYTYGSAIIDTLNKYGFFLEQNLHGDLVHQLHDQKLRDRPIKRLVLRKEEVQYRLTKNECSVLQHILDGHNNRNIAELMYLAPSTVSTVISHLLKKLGANDRTDAMVKIIRNGWVDALR